MSLIRYYAVVCDGCSQPYQRDVKASSREARADAKRNGFVRLPNPDGVRQGYVGAEDARYRRDWCAPCGVKVQAELDAIARERSLDAERAARKSATESRLRDRGLIPPRVVDEL